jgi:hypothetical protein
LRRSSPRSTTRGDHHRKQPFKYEFGNQGDRRRPPRIAKRNRPVILPKRPAPVIDTSRILRSSSDEEDEDEPQSERRVQDCDEKTPKEIGRDRKRARRDESLSFYPSRSSCKPRHHIDQGDWFYTETRLFLRLSCHGSGRLAPLEPIRSLLSKPRSSRDSPPT